MKSKRRPRINTGQGIIEGVVGLMLIIGGGVLITTLVFDSGVGALYRTKLAMVTTAAANFALSTGAKEETREQDTTTFVQQLMPVVGLTPNNLTVTTKLTTLTNGFVGCTATVSNRFSIIGNANVLPTQVQLVDTEFVAPVQQQSE